MAAPPLGLTTLVRVIRVIDGDTIVVRARDIEVTVRLLDCWARETHGDLATVGLAAKKYMQDLLPVASYAVLHVPTGEGDRLSDILTFGRVLGRVWRHNDALSVSERMVKSGYAMKEKPG